MFYIRYINIIKYVRPKNLNIIQVLLKDILKYYNLFEEISFQK